MLESVTKHVLHFFYCYSQCFRAGARAVWSCIILLLEPEPRQIVLIFFLKFLDYISQGKGVWAGAASLCLPGAGSGST
jgi:hypothetical protein